MLSPLGLFCVKGKLDTEFFINVLLAVLGLLVGGVIHAFCIYGINVVTSCLCFFLPPLGVIVGKKGTATEALVCLLLCLLGWLPGVIYAYYSVLNGTKSQKII